VGNTGWVEIGAAAVTGGSSQLESRAVSGLSNVSANFSRELTVADLGIKGVIQELRGTFSVNNGVATAQVNMIKGSINNPLKVVSNLMDTANASGATTLNIEASLANERLYNILQSRYGLTTSGGVDTITIPLR
jgi:hypothetical protein